MSSPNYVRGTRYRRGLASAERRPAPQRLHEDPASRVEPRSASSRQRPGADARADSRDLADENAKSSAARHRSHPPASASPNPPTPSSRRRIAARQHRRLRRRAVPTLQPPVRPALKATTVPACAAARLLHGNASPARSPAAASRPTRASSRRPPPAALNERPGARDPTPRPRRARRGREDEAGATARRLPLPGRQQRLGGAPVSGLRIADQGGRPGRSPDGVRPQQNRRAANDRRRQLRDDELERLERTHRRNRPRTRRTEAATRRSSSAATSQPPAST